MIYVFVAPQDEIVPIRVINDLRVCAFRCRDGRPCRHLKAEIFEQANGNFRILNACTQHEPCDNNHIEEVPRSEILNV